MSEQPSIIEKTVTEQQENKIKLNAQAVAQTVALVLSIAVLILEIVFSQSLLLGFACLGICFVVMGVEKWLTYFSLKQKNDLYTALIDSAAFVACALFTVLAVL